MIVQALSFEDSCPEKTTFDFVLLFYHDDQASLLNTVSSQASSNGGRPNFSGQKCSKIQKSNCIDGIRKPQIKKIYAGDT
jgi:hypothetical protein